MTKFIFLNILGKREFDISIFKKNPGDRIKFSWEQKVLIYGSLVGFAGGFLAGFAIYSSQNQALFKIALILEIFGILWAEILSAAILPLLFGNIVVIVASSLKARLTGIISGLALIVHLFLMTLATLYVLVVSPPVVKLCPDGGFSSPQHSSTDALTQTDSLQMNSETGFSHSLNRVEKVLIKLIFPVLMFAVLIGIILSCLPSRIGKTWFNIFQKVALLSLTAVTKILLVMPAAMFVLITAFAARRGLPAAGMGLFFIVYSSCLMLIFVWILYPVTLVLGRVKLKTFFQALLPAQIMAAGTRSSLVCLPLLQDGAENRLKLPDSITELVLPLSVTTFRLHRSISGTAKLFLLAHIYSIHLSPASIAMFVLMKAMTSFSSPGIPSGGMGGSLPMYLAVGIPAEGALIFSTLDDIPDIFKTILNVSGDMTVAVIVSRFREIFLRRNEGDPDSAENRER